MFAKTLIAFALLAASQLTAAVPSPQVSSVPVPSTVCFPPGDPLAEVMSISEVGTIIGATGVSSCPAGVACVAPTTAELEAIDSALGFDPELEFLIALLRTEEPGAALIGVSNYRNMQCL